MKKTLLITLLFSHFIATAQWVQQNSTTAINLSTVFFPTDQVGYVVQENGYLLKTTNGGTNWNNIGPHYFSGPFWFTSIDTGYAVGVGGILKTVNGGLTWVDNFTDSISISAIHFPTKNIGYAQCWNFTYDSILIYKTINAGLSWQRINSFMTLNGTIGGIPGSIFFTNATTGFLLVNTDGIYKTTNGGAHWVKKSNTNGSLFGISFPSDSIGYVVGDSTYKTTDAGNTWHFQNNPNSTLSYSVSFTDINTGYAVGGDGMTTGTIVKTIDGGINWTLSFSDPQTFSTVYFSSANTGYVCGQGGKIYKYSLPNGIENYNEINSLAIYPNPSNGKFQVSITKNNQAIGVKDVKVYDMVGRVIWESNSPSGNTFNVDISGYATGIYYLNAISEAGDIDLKKLIKE